jgi:hypothetical protein
MQSLKEHIFNKINYDQYLINFLNNFLFDNDLKVFFIKN